MDNGTHISLPPTFSPEYPAPPGPNANYDLALLRWGVTTAIEIADAHGLVSPHRHVWEEIRDKLVGFSYDEKGNYAIYEGTP